ncbi:hypothetical protein HGA91_06305 [candidate division WWE3 bacterium]|nr:hypothetical protein [candidate division WWE3 bacterium]
MKTANIFYHHLIDLSDVRKKLNELDLTEEDRVELLEIVLKTIHIELTHLILNELDSVHHEDFLLHLTERPHDHGLLVFLNRTIDDFEEKVTLLISRVKADFIESLHDYKSASEEWLAGTPRE